MSNRYTTSLGFDQDPLTTSALATSGQLDSAADSVKDIYFGLLKISQPLNEEILSLMFATFYTLMAETADLQLRK